MRRISIFTFLLLFAAGCSSKTASGGCEGNNDCQPGEVCNGGSCVVLCASDVSCGNGEICTNDVCVPGTRGVPTIDSVDGVGAPDGAAGHADHLLETHLIVSGSNLVGAQVSLTGAGTGELVLEVCDAQADQLTVKPPTTLAAGPYLLTVTNQSGNCAANLDIVQGIQGVEGPTGPIGPQGIQGPAGSPDSGSDIVVKLNEVSTTGQIVPERLSNDVWNAGGNVIPDAYFQSGLEFWTLRAGAGSLSTINDSIAGDAVFENDTQSLPWLYSTSLVPAEQTGRYTVRGSFRRPALTGSAGGFYLAVLLYDDALAEITGDGTWWFYAVSNAELTDTDWHTFSADFGLDTDNPIPANARYMSVGAILNYDTGGVAGNRIYQTAGLGIYHRNMDYASAWQSLHIAAAAACRGSTASGGSGCCDNRVRVRNRSTGQSCTTICAASGETCDAEVSIGGVPHKATANGELVGRFYNYGCSGFNNGGSEASIANEAIATANGGTTYYSFCCCRQ